MKIAIPLDNELNLYHHNPYTAPMFAIYLIEGDSEQVTFSRLRVVENIWKKIKTGSCPDEQIHCNCTLERQSNLRHVSEHYLMLDVINGCDYLLADRCCHNTKRTMKNGGIRVFKFPSIIDHIDSAIKNFLIGASLVHSLKHINHAT